jgi:hypothetical protein
MEWKGRRIILACRIGLSFDVLRSSMVFDVMLTMLPKQARLSDAVQGKQPLPLPLHTRADRKTAMGIPQQAEPGAQKSRARCTPPRTMGAELHPKGHGGYTAE